MYGIKLTIKQTVYLDQAASTLADNPDTSTAIHTGSENGLNDKHISL
jgi:hypothetical protein